MNKAGKAVGNPINYYIKYRHLLYAFIASDLKEKYAGSLVGVYWSVINPLIMIVIYTFVFSVVLKVEFHGNRSPLDFALYLICGMLPWFAIQESVNRSAGILEENASLVKKVNFPASLLPTHIVIGNMFTMLITLVLFIAFVALRMDTFSSKLVFLPFVIICQLILTLGLSLTVASLNVIFPDTKPLVQNFMLLWMFITPIFYPSAVFPKEFGFLLAINPLAHLVDLYREVIMKNNLPIDSFTSLIGVSVAIFLLGYLIFARMQAKFVDLM
ncbi:MAG: ABC transporter permease [Myxococcota bacterium]